MNVLNRSFIFLLFRYVIHRFIQITKQPQPEKNLRRLHEG